MDQGKLLESELGGTNAGEVGAANLLARLMVAHMAQTSSTLAVPFCGEDTNTVAAPAPLDSANPNLPRWRWPNESVN